MGTYMFEFFDSTTMFARHSKRQASSSAFASTAGSSLVGVCSVCVCVQSVWVQRACSVCV